MLAVSNRLFNEATTVIIYTRHVALKLTHPSVQANKLSFPQNSIQRVPTPEYSSSRKSGMERRVRALYENSRTHT